MSHKTFIFANPFLPPLLVSEAFVSLRLTRVNTVLEYILGTCTRHGSLLIKPRKNSNRPKMRQGVAHASPNRVPFKLILSYSEASFYGIFPSGSQEEKFQHPTHLSYLQVLTKPFPKALEPRHSAWGGEVGATYLLGIEMIGWRPLGEQPHSAATICKPRFSPLEGMRCHQPHP